MSSIFAISVVLLLSIVLIAKVYKKINGYGYVFLSSLIVLFYSMSLYFDYLFFGIDSFYLFNLGVGISVFDIQYLYITLLYLFFLGTFSLTSIFLVQIKNKKNNIEFRLKSRGKIPYNILLTLIIGSLLFLIANSYGVQRVDLKSNVNAVIVLHRQTILYLICIFILSKKSETTFKDIIFEKTILFLYSVYAFTAFEREHVFTLFLIFFYLYGVRDKGFSNYRINYLKSGVIMSSMIIFLFFYKMIVSMFNNSELISAEASIFSNRLNEFSLTELDPLVSLLLLKDYLNSNIINIYENYYFSYFINTIKQFLSFFGIVDQISLGNFTTNYYTGGRMGTAFSMILESMLNFFYMGPLITGGLTAFFFHKLYSYLKCFGLASELIIVLIMMKFVRTELAVILKLYVIPILIAVFIVKKVFKVVEVNGRSGSSLKAI